MKPKQLKPPCSWEDRRVILDDGILFVPDYFDAYDSFTFPGWDSPEVFGTQRPVHVEFCSGNGTWIAEKAQQHPDVNWVAIEIRFDRVRKIWSKKKNLGLDNLFVVCGEGLRSSHHYFPEGSVDTVYVNFPDPWPKKRHAKHRIIQAPFAAEAERILRDGGQCVLVTDDVPYSEQMIDVMRAHGAFAPVHGDADYLTETDGYGNSFFEQLWRRKGRGIRYHFYRKEAAVCAAQC